MKKVALIIICVFFTTSTLLAQKVKYKDLYPLLQAKKYNDAEPFLRIFIQDEKNREKYPNSLLQMGLIYTEKALSADILLENEQSISYADSAVTQFQSAMKLIDEKEVKKNDEYYQEYKRRDIRTGEFGISQADVLFDLEKKIKSLNERKSRLQELVNFFESSREAYDTAFSVYNTIKDDFKSQKRLLLQLDKPTIDALDFIAKSYNEAIENFNGYKNSLNDIKNSKYHQDLIIKEVDKLENSGSTKGSMLDNNIEIWDYKNWVNEIKNKHEEHIIPLFNQLIAFDEQLSKIQNKVYMDSASYADEIPDLSTIEQKHELEFFGDKSMPIILFEYRITRVAYDSYLMEIKSYQDSTNIDYKLRLIQSTVDRLNKLDSLMGEMSGLDLKEVNSNYKPFLEARYNESGGLESFIEDEKSFVKNQQNKYIGIEAELEEKSKWVTAANDKIPLFKPDDYSNSRYIPYITDSLVTAGLYFGPAEQTAKGYIADITPSRNAKLFAFFALDSVFQKDSYDEKAIKGKTLVLTGAEDIIYFVLLYTRDVATNQLHGIMVRARNDKLEWSSAFKLSSNPGKMAYNVSTDEVVVYYDVQDFANTNHELIGNKVIIGPDGSIKE